VISAVIWRVGSDTGIRGSSPLDFAQKTGISLSFSQVQLTIRQSAQNFDRSFFCTFEGRIQPPFSGIFWDKLRQIRPYAVDGLAIFFAVALSDRW
jgi:hypothetical protein